MNSFHDNTYLETLTQSRQGTKITAIGESHTIASDLFEMISVWIQQVFLTNIRFPLQIETYPKYIFEPMVYHKYEPLLGKRDEKKHGGKNSAQNQRYGTPDSV